jgi:hypothetical protein
LASHPIPDVGKFRLYPQRFNRLAQLIISI